jgi:Ala-tRNA(Pro) deacylase
MNANAAEKVDYPPDAQRLLDYLASLGIASQTIQHPPFFTVEDGKDWYGKIPGRNCKSLFLKDKKDQIYLVVIPGDVRADLSALEKIMGSARLSFGKPELLMEVLGMIPGSVTPFALINDKNKRVRVVLDRAILACEQVNYHPLRNDYTTVLKPDDLLKFIRSLGYEPQIAECA